MRRWTVGVPSISVLRTPFHAVPSPARGGEKGVKPGHWRPGARWAREAAVRTRALRIGRRGAGHRAHRQSRPDRRRLPGGARARHLARHDARQGAGAGARPRRAAGRCRGRRRLAGAARPVRRPPLDAARRRLGRGRALARSDRRRPSVRRRGADVRGGSSLSAAGSASPRGSRSPAGLGAAHALARFGGRPLLLCPAGGEADLLAPMPLAALRLDEEALGAARRLGLERIGELIAMPRAPLQRRFGETLLLRLDQALGRAAEPFEPIVPEEPPRSCSASSSRSPPPRRSRRRAGRRCAGWCRC